MKNVKYCIIAGWLLLILSCTINRKLSNTRNNKIYSINSEMYCLDLEKLSEIAQDSLLINDKMMALVLLKSYENQSAYDGEERSFTYRNILEVLEVGGLRNQQGTKMVFQFWIDRKGDMVAAKYDQTTTAEIDKYSKPEILKAVMGYKAEPNENAPILTSGKLTITLDDINAFGN